MSFYPQSLTGINHVEPAPRRVRGMVRGETVFDTTRALYVWEHPRYPQYYVPRADVRMEFLVPDADPVATAQGESQSHMLRRGRVERHAAARVIGVPCVDGLAGSVCFAWDALDAWFEEDEEVFVHPRSPYTRVDALRSRRAVRVEIAGIVLAESPAPVMVFETGLPTRYYVDPRDVRFERLTPSATRTACPYKGRTTGYWSVIAAGTTFEDVAWSYAFPTRQVLPIAGLIAFLNERVDVFIDAVAQPAAPAS